MLANKYLFKEILYEMVGLFSKMGRFSKLRNMCGTIKRYFKNLLMGSTLAMRSDRQTDKIGFIAPIFQDQNKHLKLIKRDTQTHLSEPSFTQAGPLIICCK
jgi:hypothetical protein